MKCVITGKLEEKIKTELESGNFSSRAEINRAALREYFKESE